MQLPRPTQRVLWQPNPGPQTRFLASTAHECLYGGAAGGGKSAGVIALPLRWVNVPDFRALILRRETTQLGNLIDKSQALYRRAFPGARFNANDHTWTFPSGARIRFNHCKDEADKFNYQGDEFQVIEFDELTHFTLGQYLELKTRVRSATPGLPRHVRATTNPGGEGHEWVFARWGAWLDPDFKAEGLAPRFDVGGRRIPPARPGEVLWIVSGDGAERYVPPGTPGARTRQFIPALLADNPQLLTVDPDYVLQLRDHDPVRRAQLEDGNWLIKPAAGLYFKRAWCPVVDRAPDGLRWVRAWDLAATAPTREAPDPDWTVGVKYAQLPNRAGWIVGHVERARFAPGGVEELLKRTAEADGKGCRIVVPQDPGQAGKSQVHNLQLLLPGYNVRARRQTGDKVTRFGPFSSKASAGLVQIVRGPWNGPYLDALEAFPDALHDDDVDATSDAHAETASPTVTPRPLGPQASFDETPFG